MTADWFRFDPEITRAETERYRVRIRTGMSVFARNRITALGMQHARERKALWDLLMRQAADLCGGAVDAAIDQHGVMQTQPFAYWVEPQQRTLVFALAWGFVLRGRPKAGKLSGDFVLAIVVDEELDDARTRLFHTQKSTVV